MRRSNVAFDKTAHTYTLDGRYLKGVTHLVKLLFPDMYSGVPEHVLKNAAERGTKIHEEIEAYEALGIDGDSPEFFAYKELKEQKGFVVTRSEFLVDNGEFCTMVDQVAEFNGVSLIDLKTTYVLHIEPLAWQLSLTAHLFEHQTGIKVEHLYGLHLRGNHAKLVEVVRKSEADVLALFSGDVFSISVPKTDETRLIQLADLEQAIIDLKNQIELAESQKKTLQEGLIEEMKKAGLKKVDTDRITIAYVEQSERTTIDSKRLKEQQPEIYAEYAKASTVKESIRIKLK